MNFEIIRGHPITKCSKCLPFFISQVFYRFLGSQSEGILQNAILSQSDPWSATTLIELSQCPGSGPRNCHMGWCTMYLVIRDSTVRVCSDTIIRINYDYDGTQIIPTGPNADHQRMTVHPHLDLGCLLAANFDASSSLTTASSRISAGTTSFCLRVSVSIKIGF